MFPRRQRRRARSDALGIHGVLGRYQGVYYFRSQGNALELLATANMRVNAAIVRFGNPCAPDDVEGRVIVFNHPRVGGRGGGPKAPAANVRMTQRRDGSVQSPPAEAIARKGNVGVAAVVRRCRRSRRGDFAVDRPVADGLRFGCGWRPRRIRRELDDLFFSTLFGSHADCARIT